MQDYLEMEEASAYKPGKVKVTGSYVLTPGITHVYNEGDLRALDRKDSISLIRI